MKDKILKILKNNNAYISGEDISRQLDVSRTAIWKYINQLKEEGYKIESSSKKGYKLIDAPNILTINEIEDGLSTKYMGRNIVYLKSTGSTNDIAKSMAAEGEGEGLVIIAEEQLAGRGRMGRSWSTGKGEAIAASILLRPGIAPQIAASITPVLAISIVEALTDVTGFDIKIKWPNDIVLGNKKLCGILTEMSADMDMVNYIVVGMGININQEEFDESIREIAVSLRSYSGRCFDRKRILAAILNRFEINYDQFKESGLAKLVDSLKRYSVLLGKRVLITNIKQSLEGKALDIDSDGSLIIQLDDGEVRKILSGDVSARGLYTYNNC